MTFDKYQKFGAYHFDWYDDPNYVWYKECVDRIVDFCGGNTIDVGGGDGLVASKIMERGFNALVLDNSLSADYLCFNRSIPFEHVDLEKESVVSPAVSVPYMACLNVIEHLKSTKGIVNLIRDNVIEGAIIITDKATAHKGRYHEHEFTKDELIETFKEFKPKYFEINSTEFGEPISFIGVEIRK